MTGILYLLRQDRFVVARVITGLWEIVASVQANQEELGEAVEVVKLKVAVQMLLAVLVVLVL